MFLSALSRGNPLYTIYRNTACRSQRTWSDRTALPKPGIPLHGIVPKNQGPPGIGYLGLNPLPVQENSCTEIAKNAQIPPRKGGTRLIRRPRHRYFASSAISRFTSLAASMCGMWPALGK